MAVWPSAVAFERGVGRVEKDLRKKGQEVPNYQKGTEIVEMVPKCWKSSFRGSIGNGDQRIDRRKQPLQNVRSPHSLFPTLPLSILYGWESWSRDVICRARTKSTRATLAIES